MIVTVVPVFEKRTDVDEHLYPVMLERLKRFAVELKEVHLRSLVNLEPLYEDVVVYLGYNSKYGVLWKVVNDVSAEVVVYVGEQCGKLGYLEWGD